MTTRRGPPLRQRAVTLTLVVAFHLLLLWLLLRFAPDFVEMKDRAGGLATFDVTAEGETALQPTRRVTRERVRQGGAPKAPRAPQPIPPEEPPAEEPASDIWKRIIPMSRDQFASGDVGRIPSSPAPGGEGGTGRSGKGAGSGEGEVAAAAGGGGPNGERLFDPDWQRRPTDAELSPYLPKNGARVGWGMVACRTIAGNRVEDCQEIGQSPPGSGLARAVRLAAWQFRVLPPRVGGKTLIGAWVRIRIDYTVRGARDTGE